MNILTPSVPRASRSARGKSSNSNSGQPMRLRTLIPILFLLASCSSPVELAHPDEDGRVLGTLEHYRDPVRIDMPTSVPAGEPFEVKVTTYGGGCISQGEVEVEVRARRATISPYDHDSSLNLPPNTVCTAALMLFTHEAVLQFEEAGTARVTIRGQRRPSREVISVVRTVEVR